MSEFKVTPASEWKRKVYEETLPSGRNVRLQKPQTVSLALRNGRLPESMSAIIKDAMSPAMKGAQANPPPNEGELAIQNSEIMDLLDLICVGSFVEPVIVENPDYEQNQIAIEDVLESDKWWVLNWAGLGGGQLTSASRSPDQPNGSLPAA